MYSLLCNQSILFMLAMLLAGGMVSNIIIASADRIRTSYPPIGKVSLVYYTQPKLIAYGALKLSHHFCPALYSAFTF